MLAAEALAEDLGPKQVVVRRVPLVAALGLGVAAELPVKGAQPAADLGARVRRLELGLGGLGVVVERQLLQPAAEDAPGVEDRQRRRRDDGAGAVAHREHEQAVAAQVPHAHGQAQGLAVEERDALLVVRRRAARLRLDGVERRPVVQDLAADRQVRVAALAPARRVLVDARGVDAVERQLEVADADLQLGAQTMTAVEREAFVHGLVPSRVDGVRSCMVHSLSRRCVSAPFAQPAQCCSQALSARATGPYDGRMADKCEVGRPRRG